MRRVQQKLLKGTRKKAKGRIHIRKFFKVERGTENDRTVAGTNGGNERVQGWCTTDKFMMVRIDDVNGGLQRATCHRAVSKEQQDARGGPSPRNFRIMDGRTREKKSVGGRGAEGACPK